MSAQTHEPLRPPIRNRLRQALIGMACAGVLLGVMWLYLRPDFLLTLANQVWGCF